MQIIGTEFAMLARLYLMYSVRSGPHVLTSNALWIYVLEGQQTVITAKNLSSQDSIKNIQWQTKPLTAWTLFEDSIIKQKNNTQVTLTMSKEMDGIRIRYKMIDTSSKGQKQFKSAAATLNNGCGHRRRIQSK
jgi:hypothetical protein